METFKDHLKTAAGSTLLILPNAKDAPPKEISAIVENMPNITNGEKLNINPDFATPIRNPSSKSIPIANPTKAKNIAWVNISRLM